MSLFACYCVITALAAMSTSVKSQGYVPTREELKALQKVETGACNDPLKAVGDNGLSIGPYQIMQSYYDDAKQFDSSLPSYESLAGPDGFANSERVMQAYSDRYTTSRRLGRDPTFEDYARNHNGGPNGYKKASTEDYYDKVSRNLPSRRKRVAESTTGEYLGCPSAASRATYMLVAQSVAIVLSLLTLAVLA